MNTFTPFILALALAAACSRTSPKAAAGPVDYFEITTELKSTWESQTRTNRRSVVATCVVGTNGWLISGDFMRNAVKDYWLVGTNVIERTTITSSMYLQQTKDFVSEKILGEKPVSRNMFSYPRAGEKFTKVHPSPQGQPAGDGVANTVWLAFCSGPYLKYPGRQVPLPLGPPSQAFGFRDKTVEFNDVLGLPKTVELYAADGRVVCEYKVLQATNFFGRSFPLKFRVVQRRNAGGAKTELVGRVTSIRIGTEPKLPADIRKQLEP